MRVSLLPHQRAHSGKQGVLGPLKRTHACPKCGCTQIVHVPASQWLFARGGNAYLGLHLGEKVLISKYICTGCGYVENWAERPQDLAALRKKL